MLVINNKYLSIQGLLVVQLYLRQFAYSLMRVTLLAHQLFRHNLANSLYYKRFKKNMLCKIRIMGMISAETAKLKLSEWNVLLKYMDFLQANGFTDCGKGQILGQISLIKEFVDEDVIDEENTNDIMVKKETTSEKILETENDGGEDELSTNVKDDGSTLLKQVSNLVSDGVKEQDQLIAIRKDESLSGDNQHITDNNKVSSDKPRGLVSRRTEALITKELNGSWLDKIKRITEIEEWR